jgi:phage terminase small subunit
MNTPNFTVRPEVVAMKTISMKSQAEAKAYLNQTPDKTHTKEELEALHRAIRFTHAFKHDESMEKMDQEELLQHNITKAVMLHADKEPVRKKIIV